MAGGSSEKRKLLPDRKCKKKTKLLQNKSTADKKKEELKRLFHQSIDATKKAIEGKNFLIKGCIRNLENTDIFLSENSLLAT